MIKFALAEMTYLKYFMPLIIEAHKRGICTQMVVDKNSKYSNPLKYINELSAILKIYETEIVFADKSSKYGGLFFTVEGGWKDRIIGKIFSLVAMTDFTVSYRDYIDRVDKVIFQSRFFADYYGTISDKNLHMGSPKYDIEYSKPKIKEKYGISGDKIALVLFPRYRDLPNVDLLKIYGYLENLGYKIILKARGKEPAENNVRPEYYFEDESWYPHPSLEFLTIADVLINFDSTAIEEAVMLNCPVLNFQIKPFSKIPMNFLYNYKYCCGVKSDIGFDKFKSSIEFLTTTDFSEEFAVSRKKHLFEKGNVSSLIMDEVIKEL